MPLTPICRAAALVLSWGLIACSGEPDRPQGTGGSDSSTVSCTDDPRLDVYTDNMQKAGQLGALDFRFSDFVPAPPAKGNNTFNVQVTEASGAVISDGLEVELIMPDHGHGTSIQPVISLDAATGTYTVKPLYLFMPGVWRITFEAVSGESAAPVDSVELHFCVEG